MNKSIVMNNGWLVDELGRKKVSNLVVVHRARGRGVWLE